MHFFKKHKRIFLVLIIFFCFVAVFLFGIIDKSHEFKSADDNYSISVYRAPLLIGSIGGGSDAPGVVILSNRFGIPIKACIVDMIQNASQPNWGDDEVSMKMVFKWHLK